MLNELDRFQFSCVQTRPLNFYLNSLPTLSDPSQFKVTVPKMICFYRIFGSTPLPHPPNANVIN